MARRNLAKEAKPKKYFISHVASVGSDKGTRELFPSLPYIISGGKVTERYYFLHVSKESERKFRVIPEFFGKESNFVQEFPKDIKKILKGDPEAKVFCVFDWDTIYQNKTNLEKYNRFVKQVQSFIDKGNVTLCPSMPSFEYWFMLHFKNTTRLVRTCEEMVKELKPYMGSYFSKKDIDLFKVLKNHHDMENPNWFRRLCADGKLDAAIKRAEDNINAAVAADNLKNQSYSYVYKAFKER